jgi:hypothetical protein
MTTEELLKMSPRQWIQKRAVMSETKKRTLQGGDLHMVRPEPTSGRELTKREQNMTEEYSRMKKRRLEVSARSRQQ